MSTVAQAVTTISVAIGLTRDIKNKWDERTLYTATVSENAYVYSNLMAWLNDQISGRKVTFVSKHAGVTRFYDGSGKADIRINGCHLTVKLEKPDIEDISKSIDFDRNSFSKSLVFTAKTKAALDALEQLLVELTDRAKREVQTVQIMNPNQYNSWDDKELPFREIDSVFLPEMVKETLIDDIETFLGNERVYGRIGIPWHRGYMLYGPPGNGKSSIVASLAHKLKMNLYNLPLSGVKDDKALAEYISRISKNSLLLLEDIDIFSKSLSRTQSDTGPTLAGLLNALDGVNTPHGLITFITTNHKNVLDEALIRPGRIDFQLELVSPVEYQITSMFKYIYGEELNVGPRQFSSMAELANIFKKHTIDPEAARLEIKE